MPSGGGNYPVMYGDVLTEQYGYDANGVEVVAAVGHQNVSYGTGSWARVSVNTPGFKSRAKLKKQGRGFDLPMNGFSFDCERNIYPRWVEYSETRNPNGSWGFIRRTGLMPIGTESLSRSSDDAIVLRFRAESQLLQGLKQNTFSAGIAFAEGNKTLSLLGQSMTKIAGAVRSVRKGDLPGAARALGVEPRKGPSWNPKKNAGVAASSNDFLTRSWLELQYGWRPLFSDIYAAADFLSTSANKLLKQKVTSRSKIRRNYSRVADTSDGTGLQGVRFSSFSEHTVKCVVYFSPPSVIDLPHALGLRDPLAIGWELVPFSFVIDWFLPIGTFLDNLTATQGLEFIKGCRTEFWRCQSDGNRTGGTYVDPAGVKRTIRQNPHEVQIKVHCERHVYSTFPRVPPPTWKNPLSLSHATSAYALLSQAFGRGLKYK